MTKRSSMQSLLVLASTTLVGAAPVSSGESSAMASLVFAAVIFGLIVSVLWVVLPFAVFGIKKRLDRIIDLQEEQIEVLRSIPLRGGDPR